MTIRIRLAEARDIPLLRELIEASVRGLQAGDYSAAQLESALRTVYGVDTQLISDGILEACEAAAGAAGFRRLEMGATLTGVPFYRAKGYVELEAAEVALGDGMTLPIVRMGKERLES